MRRRTPVSPHVNDYVNGWADDPEHSLQTGLRIARQAVEMDDEESQARFAMSVACLWSRDLDQALVESLRCLELEPNSAEGHLATAHAQIFSGDATAAVETMDAYMRLDPHFPDIVLQFLAEANISLGQFELAREALEHRIRRNPESETAHTLLASCHGNLGRLDEGRAAWARTLELNPDFTIERRRRILPFKNPADFERRLEGLRKIGAPI